MDEKVETLQVEVKRLREENSALSLMLEVVSSKYKSLQSHLQEINKNAEQFGAIHSNQIGSISVMPDNYHNNLDTNKKRPRLVEFPTAKKPLQIFVRTHPKDDSLIIKDGYHWRKYGQKVTKDNASPRAYFRCSFAPSCPAKKKVQRCIHDKSILVATYDGEHNHDSLHETLMPSSSTPKGSIVNNNVPFTIIQNDKEGMNIDHALYGWSQKDTKLSDDVMQHDHREGKIKIEEYASSLTKDPEFTAALADAVARTITGREKRQGPNLNLSLSEEK